MLNGIDPMLDELGVALTPYDSFDLLAKVGALNIDPRNAGRSTSLNALAHLVAAQVNAAGAPLITRNRLESLLRNYLGTRSMPGLMDDPAEQMFTEELVFTGGPYVVFPGLIVGNVDMLHWLLQAALSVGSSLSVGAFQDQVMRTALLCLTASNHIAQKAGFTRGMAPAHEDKGDIVVAMGDELRRRSDAVVFSQSALVNALPGQKSFNAIIEPLTAEIGAIEWDAYSFDFGVLDHTPFVRAGDQYVVPNASGLVSGLRHRILCIARDHNVLAELTRTYHLVIQREVMSLLSYWRSFPANLPLPPGSSDEFSEAVFSLDSEKILYVQLATDSAMDLQSQYDPGRWDVAQMNDDMELRNGEVIQHFGQLGFPYDRILTLCLVESLGRSYLAGYASPNDDSLLMVMSVTALKSIALLDADDQLTLWKFARARRQIRENAHVVAISPLDEYACYRSNNHGYYLSDDRRPNLINVVPGEGLDVRRRVAERFDFHGVLAPDGIHLTEVWSRYGDGIPIYHLPPSARNQSALVVEGELPVPVWVIGTAQTDERLHSLQVTLVNTVAYWIWQFDRVLRPYVSALTNGRGNFIVTLDLDMSAQWLNTVRDPLAEPLQIGPVISSSGRTETGVRLAVHPSLLTRSIVEGNEGERQLIKEFFRILQEIIGIERPDITHALYERDIDKAIDTIAPPGPKQMFLATSDAILVDDPDALGRPRVIQDADQGEALDRLGAHLRTSVVRRRSANPKGTSLLNESVKYFFEEIQKLVATLDGRDLLTRLVAYSEANTAEFVRRGSQIANRLACFGEGGKPFTELVEDTLAQNTASVANRFLIEYVVVQPPTGDRRFSIEVYDRLLAMAGEVVTLGYMSDFIQFGLIDSEVAMLPSGRLGLDHSDLTAARDNFMQTYVGDQASGHGKDVVPQVFKADDEEPATEGGSPIIEKFDGPFEKEFGISLSALLHLMDAILALETDADGPVEQLLLDRLVSALSESLKWEECTVHFGIDLLCLGPRSDFFDAPDGRKSDVYPWRFNRSWSYFRRPLLSKQTEPGPMIMWGRRHLRFSMAYLADLCVGGRLKANTRELKRVVGERRESKAVAFEELVRVLVSEITGVEAKGRVKKVGKRRIALGGADLGDIDVLGVIPSERVLLCIECKALALARTPAEVQNQAEELIGNAGKLGSIQKHQKRVEWVEEHLDQVLFECFGIDRKGRWRVKPVLVSDGELFAPHIKRIPIGALSIKTLSKLTPREIARRV